MKFKNKKSNSAISIIGLLLVMTSLTFNAFPNNIMILEEQREEELKASGSWIFDSTQLISIDDTDPTKNWLWAESQDWCTFNDSHYIIENVTINGNGIYSSGGIHIENSEVYFLIKNCTVSNVTAGDLKGGITLENVSNGILMDNNCSFNTQNGIGLDENCVNITILNNYLLNNSIGGITLMGANHTLMNNKMINCGLMFSEPYSKYDFYDQLEGLSSYYIDTSNMVNLKSLYYFKNQIGINAGSFSTGAPGQIILVNCSYAVIKEYDITNGSKGISLYFCKNSTVSKNEIENSIKGIDLFGCTNITIYDNTLIDCRAFGIELGRSNYCNITENSVTKLNTSYLYFGVSIIQSSGNTIADNTFSNLTSGINFEGYTTPIETSQSNNITGNTFLNLDHYALNMYYADYNLISNSVINGTGKGGINMLTCKGNDVLNNQIIKSGYDGIQIEGLNSYDNNISSNHIVQNGRHGIYFKKCRDNTIHNNTITNLDSNYGIFIYSDSPSQKANYNDITSNTIEHCLYGIYVKNYCEHSEITLNRLYSNSYGIYIYGKNGYGDHTINNNIIRDNSAYGIYLELSDNLIVKYNTLSNNGVCIYVKNCSDYDIEGNSCEPTIYSPDDGNDEGIPGYMLLGVIIMISMLAEVLIIRRKRTNKSY